MRRLKNYTKIFIFLFFVMFLFNIGKTETLAANKYTVTFANANGIVANSTYKRWGKTVSAGTTITLPSISSSGYKCYWVLKTSSGEKTYQMGSKYTVTQNVKFLLHRDKLYTIKFYDSTGTSCYTSLTKYLTDGQILTFPSISDDESQQFLGWSLYKEAESPQYKAAGRYKVRKSINFYASVKLIRTIRLYTCGGTLYKTLVLPKGTTSTFPFVSISNGTVLGWSTKKGLHTTPSYYQGESIPVVGENFYMVSYLASAEKLLTPAQLIQPSNYSHVYIVGDSRTYRAGNDFGAYLNNVTFIAKTGMGLAWLKGQVSGSDGGYPQLIKALNSNYNKKNVKKSAIVFNLGVNDMSNVSGYISYMNSIAPTLKSVYNCDLYFMSVNPVSDLLLKKYIQATGISTLPRTESMVTSFNRNMYYGLDRNYYTYIDTCSYLRRNGWISYMTAKNLYDGLHYSTPTSQVIYNYMMKYIESHY